jgi:hypothetical protein
MKTWPLSPRNLLSVLALAGLAATSQPAMAQEDENLRLFLDCSGFRCDSDFFRTEIPFVNHVRNREDADVHLLITQQQTGGGGREHTLLFLGQRRFAGMADTLQYHASQVATDDERRTGLARVAKIGLARYVARTGAVDRLAVSFSGEDEGTPVAAVDDPWNFWTFRTNVRGFFNGESRFTSRSLNGSISANRITEDWKIQLSANANESKRTFEVDSTRTVISRQEGFGLNSLVGRSLSDHWSIGGRAEASSSTFLNQDLHTRIGPVLEYSVYPYAEATRRQITVQYTVGLNHFDYDEITIFGEGKETIGDHRLIGALEMRQPWGNMSIGASGSQFLHDLRRYSAETYGDADIRLYKGLSVNFFGSVSYIRDQIHLSAAGATPEEVILRQQQLDTNYRYFGSIGVSYTFGSIYNNVVNPRLGGGGRRMIFF